MYFNKLAKKKYRAPVAQWIEHTPPTRGVGRSNRLRCAKRRKSKGLRRYYFVMPAVISLVAILSTAGRFGKMFPTGLFAAALPPRFLS